MEDKSSITALMSAFVRAYHTETSGTPVFCDSAAEKLLLSEEKKQIASYILSGADFFAPEAKAKTSDKAELLDYIINTQLAPTPVARAKYCEERLKTEILTGTTQYVILGAGYDTFCLREKELMKRLTVFEADHPLTQQDKRRRLERAGFETPENLRFVPIDFSSQSLKEQLIFAGFDMTQKTFFSLLGVSFYLTEEQLRKTLSEISEISPEGSTIVFDYGDSNLPFSEVRRVKNMLAMAAAGGEPMKFFCDSGMLSEILEDCGFKIYEELSPEEIDGEILGNSDITAFENISYVTAVLKGAGFINTKEKILRTALRLFALRGADSVSVRDIAGELGVTQAALYKHYKSKQDIFDSILKRMEQRDSELAAENNVAAENSKKGKEPPKTSAGDFRAFTLSMFRYWTADSFAADFRRMITIEQYRSPETERLYRQYLSAGPLSYCEDFFRGAGCKNYREKALLFYSPMFMLINLYDSAENKGEIVTALKNHINNFTMED